MYGWVGVVVCLTFGFDSRPPVPVARSSALRPVRAEIEQLVEELARDGLPVELVVRKVREGQAKGVAAARVLAAARAVAADVRLADRVVRKHFSRPGRRAQMIRAAVAAHRAGVSLADIDRVVAAAAAVGAELTEPALYAAADLAGRGYRPGRSTDLVVALLGRPQGAAELPRALAAVEAARAGGAESRPAALDAVLEAVEAGATLAVVPGGRGWFEPGSQQR